MLLHAEVAAALGWTALQDRGDGLWIGVQPETGLTVEVPPYGRSWCSTGPLCEKGEISLMRNDGQWCASAPYNGTPSRFYIEADSPCEAIAKAFVGASRKKDK